MKPQLLGVLLRVHRRYKTLEIVFDELLRYRTFPGIELRISVMADRPTKEVLDVLDRYRTYCRDVLYAQRPLVSKTYGELFMQGLNAQLECLEKANCDWYLLQDDDHWFEPTAITAELPKLLHNKDVDLWFANSLFVWDTPTQYHADRHHYSPAIFRALPGDRYPLNRIIHATENRHDQAIMSGRTGKITSPILDYGCYDSIERRHVYDTFAEAGKIDPYTTALISPAKLLTFPEDAYKAGLTPSLEWSDLWSKYKHA